MLATSQILDKVCFRREFNVSTLSFLLSWYQFLFFLAYYLCETFHYVIIWDIILSYLIFYLWHFLVFYLIFTIAYRQVRLFELFLYWFVLNRQSPLIISQYVMKRRQPEPNQWILNQPHVFFFLHWWDRYFDFLSFNGFVEIFRY